MTVQWGGKPGMDEYGMVSLGRVEESASERDERPDPQLLVVIKMNINSRVHLVQRVRYPFFSRSHAI